MHWFYLNRIQKCGKEAVWFQVSFTKLCGAQFDHVWKNGLETRHGFASKRCWWIEDSTVEVTSSRLINIHEALRVHFLHLLLLVHLSNPYGE